MLYHAKTQAPHIKSLTETASSLQHLEISLNPQEGMPSTLLPERLRLHVPNTSNNRETDQSRTDGSLTHPITKQIVNLWNGGILGVLAISLLKGGLVGLSEMATALAGPQILAVAIVGLACAIERHMRDPMRHHRG